MHTLFQAFLLFLAFLAFAVVSLSIMGTGPLFIPACDSACAERGQEFVNVNFHECTCTSSDTDDGLVTFWLKK